MRGAGVTIDTILDAAARLADEDGFAALTLAGVAARLGIRTPSLYNHVENLADLQHRLAVLAMTEMDEEIRERMLGLSGRDALAALACATSDYVAEHPGRYTATIGARLSAPDDPLTIAGGRVIEAITAVLRAYRIPESEMVHAIRSIRCALHGYALLEATDAFQWSDDAEQSLEWMINLIDRGLTR